MRTRHYDIVMPTLTGAGAYGFDARRDRERPGIVLSPPITPESPLELRAAVYQAASYYRREFSYDITPYGYEGREIDPRATAFVWTDLLFIPYAAVGACCFRWRDGRHGYDGGYWVLHWTWLHPYLRRHGLLTQAWPYFNEQFPGFLVEGPIPPAMRAFLAKQGQLDRLTDGRVMWDA